MPINYFSEEINFTLADQDKVTAWLDYVLAEEDSRAEEINYIFCGDEYLLAINRQYLNHDNYTDIITFDNSETKGRIAADIYISIERVKENALTLGIAFADELHRVMVHGLLHLLGYGDKTPAQKKEMREKEDACLSLR